MASAVAMLMGGAILNTTTFVGGSYLARYLSGDSSKDSLYKKERHDKTLEKYQKDYAAYQKRQKFLDWENENRRNNAIASRNFANTDEALKYYNGTNEDEHLPDEPPQFSDNYKPSKNQKFGEMVYIGGSMFALGYIVTRFL